MDNLLAVTFEAHNSEQNHHRRYEIRVGRDLFGDWTVAFRYGRKGQPGQEIRHASHDPAPLRQLIRQCLCRRLSAPKRIGCRYAITELSASEGMTPDNWFPVGFMSEFTSMLRQLA